MQFITRFYANPIVWWSVACQCFWHLVAKDLQTFEVLCRNVITVICRHLPQIFFICQCQPMLCSCKWIQRARSNPVGHSISSSLPKGSNFCVKSLPLCVGDQMAELATFPTRNDGFRLGLELELNSCKGFYYIKTQPIAVVPFFNQKLCIWTLQLCVEVKIWVLIILWHDPWVGCSVWGTLSSPAEIFKIGSILVESLLKPNKFHMKFALTSQPLNKCQSDRKSKYWGWMSFRHSTICICIISWSDLNSKT